MAGKARDKYGLGKKLKHQQVTNKELYSIAGGVPTQAFSSVVSAGSQGGGTYQNVQSADIYMNTYDIVDIDRLKFAVKEGAGDLLSNTDYGIEALYVSGDAYGMWFRIPAISAEGNNTQYIFYHGDIQMVHISLAEIVLNNDVRIEGFVDVDNIAEPSSPSGGDRRLFVDSGNSDHLSVKKSDGNVVDLEAGGVPTGTTRPTFDVIIPPPGGHGKDIYRELGAYNVLLYSRIENDIENPDFITGNQIARVGIIENPKATSGALLSADKASAVGALRLTGAGYSSATFDADAYFTQTVSAGTTAAARVVNYDQTTGVLKYWQDRTVAGFNTVGTAQTNPTYGYNLTAFTASPGTNGSLTITPTSGSNLAIDTSFTGVSTVINNRTYYLGQEFTSGLASPEVKPYSGNIVYVDNRPSITRSTNQKEDIKVILQF